MKKSTIVLCMLLSSFAGVAQPAWKPAHSVITTPWAEQVKPEAVLTQYPRPQLVRSSWSNLNGLWQFAITGKGASRMEGSQGSILVPFAVESSLSGVGKRVGKDSVLWYRRSITIPPSMKGKTILLHFGAVDWQCDVFVNGQKVGSHEGGFDPFTFDITNAVSKGKSHEVTVRVWDPSDEGPQPRGKQVKDPNSIWYTPVTGIWQTVWLEAVNPTYIRSTKHVSDIEKNEIRISARVAGWRTGDELRVTVKDGSRQIAEKTVRDTIVTLSIPDAKLWSPESPSLYDVSLAILRKGKRLDEAASYFAMREIAVKPDAQGFLRLALNGQFVFQYGPLDQGWWPDGLYTAPTEEALLFDIIKTKEMGFNMIRKHVKVEPARWYYHCDRLGLLVWQDMPSGDMGNRWDSRPGILGLATEKERTPESERIFRREWKAIMDATFNFPSIVVWVPFNEAWGQFKTEEIVRWTMEYDPSRVVNAASGGNFSKAGHIIDLHNYPAPAMPDPKLFGKEHVIVLGEFGGLGLPLEGHTWQQKDNWGYQSFSNQDELFSRYNEFVESLQSLIAQGLSAAVYTQTTDVEIEINGLMTYDRKVIKMPADKLKALHEKLYALKIK